MVSTGEEWRGDSGSGAQRCQVRIVLSPRVTPAPRGSPSAGVGRYPMTLRSAERRTYFTKSSIAPTLDDVLLRLRRVSWIGYMNGLGRVCRRGGRLSCRSAERPASKCHSYQHSQDSDGQSNAAHSMPLSKLRADGETLLRV